MISFKALNEISANDESSFSVFHEVRQEEQEAEALLLYNEGLKLSKEGEDLKAEEKLLDVLNTELISQCEDTLGEDEELSTKPSLFLKYNVLKTLATAYEKRNECEKALQYFLQAGLVDESDVTLWWKIATISRKLLNLRLERYAYEKILLYSPHHLPSINGLVSVLYVIACLHLINKLFEINSQLVKGHAFRDQIFKEEPHLKHEYLRKFEFISTENETENKELHQKIVQEALILRENRNLLSCKAEEVCLEKFTKPLLYYTWLNLGECILDLYTTLMNRTNFRTLSYKVDLQRYQKTPEQQESLNLPSPVVTQKKKSKTKDGHSLKRKQLVINSTTGPQPKRRSTRVRYSKRVELDVNWAELIFSYFPEPYKSEEMLTPATMSDCSQATSSNGSQQTDVVAMETDKQTSPKITTTRRDEVVAVSNFINSKLENSGCINIISSYMFAVAEYFENREWLETLNSVFVELYKKFKNHALQPESAITASDEEKRKLAKLLLLALELQFEQIINREGVIVSPVKTNGKEDEQTRHFLSTFHFLSTLGGECNQLSNEFLTRFYWLHGQYCLLMNQVHCAVNAFNNCCFYLERNDLSEVSVPHNLSLINEASIQRKLESVKQNQSLDEIQRLFDANRYEEVINVLQCLMEDKEDELFLSDRPSHYHLLQKAYQSTNQHEKSVECCNDALAEILCQQLDQYKSVIGEMLNSLNSSVSLLTKPLDYLQRQTLIESLTKIIEIIMESETTDKWSVATEPWIILHKLIKMNPLDASDEKESSNSDEFLRTAHVYLGKKYVCCNNQGDFLFYCINEFKQQLLKTSSNKEKEILRNDIEQCLFCLFGDPCKKTKSKIFQEHMPKPIELTWSNALLLYEFYIPPEEANFDLRANTITQEVQNVFRKVFATVPTKQIEVINSEDVQSYIERSIVQLPTLKKPQITNPMPKLCYSLADFYFKNKEFTKAIRFYVNDIAWNGSQRFQSWAAMALARGSRLEEKINMYNFKSEAVIKKHITSTLRCFEKAVSVQDSKCVLFEEYGQIAYTLHSFSSRRLKENMHTPLENKPDTMDYYTGLRARTLPLTFDCMTRALRLTSEREGEMWMHMYLQGKVREKIQRSPDHYLNFYHESLNELYKSGANLEKKIPYHGAQKYSIECIEVFYRIYASILKELKYAEEIDYIVLLKHLDRVLNQKIYVEAQSITVKTSHKERKSEESNTEETVDEAVKSTLDRLLAQFEQQCEKSINENVMEIGGEEKYILLPSGNETRESIFEETDIQEEPKKQNSICDYESIVKETLEGIVCKVCRRETDRGLIGRTVIDRSCDPPEERILYRKIAEKCIEGLEFCMRKFPEHYKSQYALAHFLYVDDTFKDWHRSRDLLLGACGSCQLDLPFRGLFCTRKKTNLFQYIWRIPVNEVDRAGSFLAHIAQMVGLLLLVLHATRNTPLLLHVVAFLHKTPDKDRKYLHDNQRSHLASQAIRLLLDALNSKLQKKKVNSTLLNECLEAFKMCQKLQKQQYQKMAEVCLRMGYTMLYPEKGHVDTKTIIEDIGKT